MWWSDEEWAAMSDAAECGMCADAHLVKNAHSLLVTSTPATYVRLSRNQAHPGYALVILRDHATDLADLTSAALNAFWADVQRTGRSIASVFAPRKIDYLIMGHRMPHLHCHLLPQHAGDDPIRNVDISDGPTIPPEAALVNTVSRLREAWSSFD
ncbi:HIT family protein [Microbacterium sp. NPDC055903]